MILDKIENAKLYYSIGPEIEKALRYLETHDLTAAITGKTPIEENIIILSVSEYTTKSLDKGLLEAHRKNIDVQFMIRGDEKIGFNFLGQSEASTDYNEEKDIQFFGSNASFFELRERMFAIFFPTDLHMPSLEINSPAKVKKAVIKVRI